MSSPQHLKVRNILRFFTKFCSAYFENSHAESRWQVHLSYTVQEHFFSGSKEKKNLSFTWDFYHPEDPLFGPQDSVAWDDWFDDTTSAPDIAARGVAYGYLASHTATWYYDASAVVHHVFVAAYRAPFDAGPNRVRLADAAFLDVDRAEALHPALDEIVQGTVKPATRSTWLLLKDLAEV